MAASAANFARGFPDTFLKAGTRERQPDYPTSHAVMQKEGRVIQPHTVVHTGYRWHVRAWCEKNGDFRDFVLSRISDTPELVLPAEHGVQDDVAWQTLVTIRLKPDPRLNKAQQALIARDYGMRAWSVEYCYARGVGELCVAVFARRSGAGGAVCPGAADCD